MNIAICEDDLIFRQELYEHLNNILGINFRSPHLYTSGEGFLENCADIRNLNMVFLDVKLNGDKNGFETARDFRTLNRHAAIIFCTGLHVSLPAEFVHVNAYDFIIKTIGRERIRRQLYIIISRYLHPPETIMLYNQYSGIISLDLNEILYFKKSRNKRIWVKRVQDAVIDPGDKHTEPGFLWCDESLDSIFEKVRRFGFTRVNHSEIINLHYVKQIQSRKATLKNDEIISVSDKYQDSLRSEHAVLSQSSSRGLK